MDAETPSVKAHTAEELRTKIEQLQTRQAKYEAIQQTQGITVYTAKPHTSANHKQGLFTEEDFRYGAEQDLYRCPAKPSAGVFTQSDDSLGGRIGKQPTPTA